MNLNRQRPFRAVRGVGLDARSRCVHWNGPDDIVAIRFHCCGEWYACFDCHQELAGHLASRWPADRREEHAIRCGSCGGTASIASYMEAPVCPRCGSAFNPRCALHHHLYFDSPDSDPR